jgi:orotidine-5'-phosphate decarboxylase
MTRNFSVIPSEVEESLSVQMTNDIIIVALDVPGKEQALALVDQLGERISFFKVGLQLYTASGPLIVREICERGSKVFLDLKLQDIPNSVARAVEAAGEVGADMLTIHLSGGREMIRAAIAAQSADMSILGVTVLTSVDEQTLRDTGIADNIENQVLRLAKLGIEHGVAGIVASPREIKLLRREFGSKIKIVVPGIRPSWSEPGEQKRVMTPRDAIAAGADYLVIGRPITANSHPRAALEKILEEIGA